MDVTFRGVRRIERGDEGGYETGELEDVESVDAGAEPSLRVGHLSDVHFGKPLEDATVQELLERWLQLFVERGVDVVVYSGDIVEEPDDRVGMLRMRTILESADVPWVAVPGNHDIARPGADSPFYEIFGTFPQVEQLCGAEFALLDSLGEFPVRERDPFDRLDALRTGAYSKGRVGSRQLAAAESMFTAGDHPRVVVVHHHLVPEESVLEDPPPSSAPDVLMVPCLDSREVLQWARTVGADFVFHGHMHAHWPPYVSEGRPVIFNSGSSTRGKPRPRARLVDFENNGDSCTVWEYEMRA